MVKRDFAALLVVALALLGATPSPSAQTNTAEIFGTVHDSQGGVLSGVTVAAVNAANGTRVERVSDERGRYRLPELSVGTYDVVATLSGFSRAIRTGVMLQLGQQLELTLTVQLGGVSEDVTVSAVAPLLQCSKPARCQTSAASGPDTTFTCWTA